MAFIKKIRRKWQNQQKWTVAAVTQDKPVSTDELCVWVLRCAIEAPLELLHIADSTTASKGDVYNVLMSLPKIMELFMKNGRSVKLEDIGTFRYTVTAGMVDKEADADESLIRDVKVQLLTPVISNKVFAA